MYLLRDIIIYIRRNPYLYSLNVISHLTTFLFNIIVYKGFNALGTFTPLSHLIMYLAKITNKNYYIIIII